MAVNTATAFSKKVDERFHLGSIVLPGLNNDYKITGEKTVKVYSIPTVAMTDYDREGTNDSTTALHRYGVPANLGNNVQDLIMTKDRAFSFIIDRADYEQTQHVMAIGKALQRQLDEVIVPEYDKYVLDKLARGAKNKDNTGATSANAYDLFLAAQEAISDEEAPLAGRICFCTQGFYNKVSKLNGAFRRHGDLSQKQLASGFLGDVDGVKMILVPKNRMPKVTASGSTTYADFILTNPIAATGPKQLWEYKVHDNPPGISGWLAEGRFLYDCFVLNNKKGAIFYQGPTLAA